MNYREKIGGEMTREDILREVKGLEGVKVRFVSKSKYMSRRYKPEFVTSEAWVFAPNTPAGYLITEEDYNNQEYRKQFFNMIREENRGVK